MIFTVREIQLISNFNAHTRLLQNILERGIVVMEYKAVSTRLLKQYSLRHFYKLFPFQKLIRSMRQLLPLVCVKFFILINRQLYIQFSLIDELIEMIINPQGIVHAGISVTRNQMRTQLREMHKCQMITCLGLCCSIGIAIPFQWLNSSKILRGINGERFDE